MKNDSDEAFFSTVANVEGEFVGDLDGFRGQFDKIDTNGYGAY